MSTQLRDLPSGEKRAEVLATILQQLVRGLLGQDGNGIKVTATKHKGTDAANVFSSADTTNGIGLDASSQNGTYRVVIRNSGLTVTGAPTFSAMTQGSVLFAGAAGLLSQDNANFSWTDSTDLLSAANLTVPTKAGIGGATGTETLVVTGTQQVTQRLGVGGAPDATAAAKVTGDLLVTVGAKVKTTLFVVDGTNNNVSVGAASASTAAKLDVTGYIRSSGNGAIPSAGQGLELGYYDTGEARIQVVNRTAGTVYENLRLRGASVTLEDGTNTVFEVDTTGIGVFGETPIAQQSIAAAATDLASVITLANDLRSTLRDYGWFS